MPTIHDVAREAGVSISTVSRVIQGASNVLPETRERVEQVIRQLNYHPNRLAQQFRVQQTRCILVIVPSIGNTFYAEILSGIESVANKQGYTILLVDSHADANIEERCYDMLAQKLVDGIITFSTGIQKDKLKQLAKQYPIVIACRYFADNEIANVTIDNIKAIKAMTSYMLNLGHKRVAYLAGPQDILLYQDRCKGFEEAIKERGYQVTPEQIIHCDASIPGGYEAISALMNNARLNFSSIVSSGDTMAIGAIRALNDHGIRVPEDVAVAGFDDIELSSLFNPTLTTVRQPKQLIGARSMEKLLDLIAGKELINRRDIVNYELVIRESSGCFVGNLP